MQANGLDSDRQKAEFIPSATNRRTFADLFVSLTLEKERPLPGQKGVLLGLPDSKLWEANSTGAGTGSVRSSPWADEIEFTRSSV